jgi:hypothetical protein
MPRSAATGRVFVLAGDHLTGAGGSVPVTGLLEQPQGPFEVPARLVVSATRSFMSTPASS